MNRVEPKASWWVLNGLLQWPKDGLDTVVGHQNNVHGIKQQCNGQGLRLREEAPAHSKAGLKELHFSGFSGRK